MINLDELKKDVLVFDIETSSHYPDNGKEINIKTNYDDYVKNAIVKWIGLYSYKFNKYFSFDYKNIEIIKDIIDSHKILIGFNSKSFDYPILLNNGYVNEEQFFTHIDCMTTLGRSVFKDIDGYKFKNKGELMKYKFKKNSLRHMAETMGLETQKGEIDYSIFHKNEWSEEEQNEIITYLKSDVMATKQMFDKLWEFWKPFAHMLDDKSIRKLTWIKSSIASLTYQCACNFMGVEPTYSDKKGVKEEVGGFVLIPQIEEETDVFYCDFSSLYPHTYVQFNLFGECEPDDTNPFAWHGNEIFTVNGYYNISKHHPLSEKVQEKLKERINLQKIDSKNPMVYALKIWLNSLYGANRSPIFEQIHTPNSGPDCCLLSQQQNAYVRKRLNDFGFITLYADTDSNLCKNYNSEKNTETYLRTCLDTILYEIQANVPFPSETFGIKIEHKLDYIMFPFSEQPLQDENGNNIKKGNRLIKEWKGRKKNYLMKYTENGETKIELVGLPIKKDNATVLGMKIFEEVLQPLILKNNRAKFSKAFIEEIINDYLQKPGILETLAREFKCKPYSSYKNPESQLQAQISKHYFYESDGIINLIKNKKIGIGKGSKYCSISEAKEAKLTIKDLELDKLYNELQPFIKNEK